MMIKLKGNLYVGLWIYLLIFYTGIITRGDEGYGSRGDEDAELILSDNWLGSDPILI